MKEFATEQEENQQKNIRYLEVELTQGALDNGYISLPSNQQFFQSVFIVNSEGQAESLFSLVLPNGVVKQTCVLSKYNRIQLRFGALFKNLDLKPGDKAVLTSDAINSSRFYLSFKGQHGDDEKELSFSKSNFHPLIAHPLNQILFGPPGTGKTYATIDEALRILDPDFLIQNRSNRKELKERFDHFVGLGQVRFTTFHQSFSYEDFVEGLRAELDEDSKQLNYYIEDGIFKLLCNAAREKPASNAAIGVSLKPRIWKISIDGTGNSATRDYCLAHGEARIGWGHVGDIRQADLNDPKWKLGSNDKSCLQSFGMEVATGDILLCIRSITNVAAVGVVQDEYRFETTVPNGINEDYYHVLPVKWVLPDIDFPILSLNSQKRFTLKTVYELTRFTWDELERALITADYQLPKSSGDIEQELQRPYVLIIDEINRGNVSRILGELITLIEHSKRSGSDEALEVILPYSKKQFSIPNNVYLIGTMNTTDRSLAGLDIALRRRFTFIEMPPRPDLLDEIDVEDVNIGELLRMMNARIEVLLDRDHCLGHAYFMHLTAESGLADLTPIFRQQIFPLLQEYFFEDWERIAWIFNDHLKPKHLAFLQKASADLSSLFGSNVASNLQNSDRRWVINEEAFENIESYRTIIEIGA
jgi:5-methylcytosine-specific restriction protein B